MGKAPKATTPCDRRAVNRAKTVPLLTEASVRFHRDEMRVNNEAAWGGADELKWEAGNQGHLWSLPDVEHLDLIGRDDLGAVYDVMPATARGDHHGLHAGANAAQGAEKSIAVARENKITQAPWNGCPRDMTYTAQKGCRVIVFKQRHREVQVGHLQTSNKLACVHGSCGWMIFDDNLVCLRLYGVRLDAHRRPPCNAAEHDEPKPGFNGSGRLAGLGSAEAHFAMRLRRIHPAAPNENTPAIKIKGISPAVWGKAAMTGRGWTRGRAGADP